MIYNGKPDQNGWFGGTTIFGNIHVNPLKIALAKNTAEMVPAERKNKETINQSIVGPSIFNVGESIHVNFL